jgi:hypothetical protein
VIARQVTPVVPEPLEVDALLPLEVDALLPLEVDALLPDAPLDPDPLLPDAPTLLVELLALARPLDALLPEAPPMGLDEVPLPELELLAELDRRAVPPQPTTPANATDSSSAFPIRELIAPP